MQESRIAQCLVVLACAATLWRLARTLPWQNVIACGALIAGFSGVVEIINVKTGVPFGRLLYTDNFGPRLFHQLPWPVPLLWVVIVLNARGVARLMLRPFRSGINYGWLVLALAASFAVLFDVGLEPIASLANHWWNWDSPKALVSRLGVPWTNFISWGIATFLMLIFATPWLIDKKPAHEALPDFFPLFLWLVLNLFLTIGNLSHGFWTTASLILATNLIFSFLALRKARLGRVI